VLVFSHSKQSAFSSQRSAGKLLLSVGNVCGFGGKKARTVRDRSRPGPRAGTAADAKKPVQCRVSPRAARWPAQCTPSRSAQSGTMRAAGARASACRNAPRIG
jgi:hypothetical protein